MTDPEAGLAPTGPEVAAAPAHLPPPPSAESDVKGFVPYLGPEPTRSTPFGVALTALATLVACVSAILAVKYWLRRNLWLAGADAGTTAASIERLNANATLTDPLVTARHVLIPITVLVGVLWCISRRAPQDPSHTGPSFIEQPLLRSMPAWLWLLPPLLIALGMVLTMAANAGLSEPAWKFADVVALNEHKAELNTLASLGSFARTGAWALVALGPRYAERAHRRRLDRSRPYRPLTPF